MHTGINTGLIVTGEEQLGKDRHGLTGDTINTAKHLTSLASENEIFIGTDTFQQVQAFFETEVREPTLVKRKADPVPVFKIVSALDQQQVTECLYGVQADLIGRDAEMAFLMEAVESLKQGFFRVTKIIRLCDEQQCSN